MLKKLSLILTIGSFIITFCLGLLFKLKLGFIILFSFLAFIIVLGVYCVWIMLTLCSFASAKVTKTEEQYRKYMHELSDFILFWLGMKIHVKGLEKLNKENTYVFYSNHQGFIDIFLNDAILKEFNFASMYKIEHNNNPLFKGLVKALGGVAIDRTNDRQAAQGVIEIIKKVRSGTNFMIYPEGTRSRGLKLKNYHAGSFKVIQKTNATMAIIVIDGCYKKSCFIPLFPTHLYFEVVDVVDSESIKLLPTKELAEMVQNKAQAALDDARRKK